MDTKNFWRLKEASSLWFLEQVYLSQRQKIFQASEGFESILKSQWYNHLLAYESISLSMFMLRNSKGKTSMREENSLYMKWGILACIQT